MKRLIPLVLIACLCLTMIPSVGLAAEDWSNAYQDFVLNQKFLSAAQDYFTGDSVSSPHWTFSLHDFEQDGIPELLIYNDQSMAMSGWHVYTFRNRKIQYLGKIGFRSGSFMYTQNSLYPGLFYQSGHMDYYPGYYYYMENGVLKEEHVLDTIGEINRRTEDITYSVTPVTWDSTLFQTCYLRWTYDGGATEPILWENDLSQIRSIGWDAFVASYPRHLRPVAVELNGQRVAFDQEPVIQDGRTLVPLRAIFEAMGASVKWDAATQTVSSTRNGTTIVLTIGSNILYKNNTPITLDVPAQIMGNRTMVPLRAIAESFGAAVSWDESTRTVAIRYSN